MCRSGTERFHRTIQDEFYAVAFRKKLYHSLSELQKDLDSWLNHYNTQRTHTGKYCYGKTPMQTFIDSLQLAKDKLLEEVFKINTLEDNKKMTEVPVQSSNPEFNWNAINMLADS